MIRNIVLFILLLISSNPVFAIAGYEQFVKDNPGIYLNYDDLVELSQTAVPKGKLLEKLQSQLNYPVIKEPLEPRAGFLHNYILHDFFRVGSWNIERGFNIDLIEKLVQEKDLLELKEEVKEELDAFLNSDVIVLNEVDNGVPRTHYENIAKRFADLLKMGYVYGVEFTEVDPYQLGIRKFTKEERLFLEDEALKELDNIDAKRFLGLHGTAILTRYPMLSAKIIRLPECYQWYLKESEKLSALELARRTAAKIIFSSKVLTELRHGGRIALVVDLLLPNKQKITVVGTHLENRCLPACRFKQFEFLLNRLRNTENPLILAGDFNTTGTDAGPVTLKKEVLKRVKDPEFLIANAVLFFTPLTFIQGFIIDNANSLRLFKDPASKNIPLVWPNKEKKLFDYLADFRFNDGNAFDVRGVSKKSYGNNLGFLSDSNERELKGFKPTFEFERPVGIGKYKLDWMFVKPLSLKDPKDKKESYSYAPHFGRTLQRLNRKYGGRISDHDPIIVDIPVTEPLPAQTN